MPGAATAGTSQTNGYWLPGATFTWGSPAADAGPGVCLQDHCPAPVPRTDQPALLRSGTPTASIAATRCWWTASCTMRKRASSGISRRSSGCRWRGSTTDFTARSRRSSIPRLSLPTPMRPGDALWRRVRRAEALQPGDEGFLAARRLLLVGNYTFTKSKLKVAPGDEVQVFGAFSTSARDYFTDGAKLTGQSDHIVNFEIGLENQDKLCSRPSWSPMPGRWSAAGCSARRRSPTCSAIRN